MSNASIVATVVECDIIASRFKKPAQRAAYYHNVERAHCLQSRLDYESNVRRRLAEYAVEVRQICGNAGNMNGDEIRLLASQIRQELNESEQKDESNG
jgi:hypothetical protein